MAVKMLKETGNSVPLLINRPGMEPFALMVTLRMACLAPMPTVIAKPTPQSEFYNLIKNELKLEA
jgi:hypothetical protein